MGKVFYQKYEMPDGMAAEALKLAEKCVKKDDNSLRRGTNETTKAIEKGTAKLVYLSLDVDPPEIVGHIPLLCEDKKVPYVFVDTKKELGKVAGLDVSMASAALVDFVEFSKDGESLSLRAKELAKMK
ncbi:MAG: 50S ribosomal protein L7Ae [Candidatus Heimdallarchaeota archaeon LC_3]|nr:MAG: 50S ribosomal protein L7Ae [Candidatus Heimdallarchaeota archaeon LC_3]